MSKVKLRSKRLKNLKNGKIRSIGFLEKYSMKYAGWVDGRKGLLRCNEDGMWQSVVLKQEMDSYEEFCAKEFGKLKVEEESEFNQMNILFDKIITLRKKLSDAKERLYTAKMEEFDLNERREGEENLTNMQVTARRSRERSELLQPLQSNVTEYETQLSATVDEIFTRLSQVNESFDSTVKMMNHLLQHSQRRIDIYWRSAMRHVPELPALPDVVFSNVSEQMFAGHYEKIAVKAEKLRMEVSELYGEVM